MSRAGDFLDKTQYTREIGGVEFVLRRLTPLAAARALGSRLFGVVSGVQKKQVGDYTETEKKAMAEVSRKILEVAMVSPRLGDVSDSGNDTVSYEDLAASGYAELIFAEVSASAGDAEGFRKSCEDSTEGDSQETLTPSPSGTDAGPAS